MPPVLNNQSGYDEGESVATDSLYDEKDNFELRRVGKRPVLGVSVLGFYRHLPSSS